MTSKRGIRFFAIFFIFIISTGVFAMRELKLIPKPREYKMTGGEVSLSKDWKIYLPANTEEERIAANSLAEEALNCFGWEFAIAASEPESGVIIIKMIPPDNNEPELFNQQGYTLAIEERKITSEGASAAGRFYGAQTLRQIFRNADGARIPLMRIKDWPSLKWRGISDDISRGQVSMAEDFKNIIRELAFYKKNLYQPYIEDMFAFDSSPQVGRARGAITKSEMAEMVAEAKKYHVTLVPVFECLGHQDRLLSLPENRQYAELQTPGKDPWSFSPVNEDAFLFVTKLIDELAASAPSPFFHIGGDESWDVGKGTSAKEVKKKGLGRVHAEYFSRLNRHIQTRHNRKTMLYADMILKHPEALPHLDNDCIMVDWHYEANNIEYSSISKLKEAGFKYIIASPGIWSWANYYPNYSNGFASVGNFSAKAKAEDLMGCITSSWGDDGAENLRENNWLGYAFSAAAEWEAETPDADRFLRKYAAVHLGCDSESLAAAIKNLGWFDYLNVNYLARIFHKMPRIKQVDAKWLEALAQLKEKMEETRKELRLRRPGLRFHKDYIDIMDNAARRNIYLAERDKAMDTLARMLGEKKSGELSPANQQEIIALLEKLRDDLAGIAGEFQELWLKRYKYPKLDSNMQRLGAQLGVLQDFIALAKTGDLTMRQPTEAVWFWYPDVNPQESATSGTRYFMRVFELAKEPKEGAVRCWADDKAAVYVNGERVLEVSYYDQPKLRRVSSLLKKGKNYIAIEAENTIGAAGILFEARILVDDDTTLVITGDDEWRVKEKVPASWVTKAFKGGKSLKVKLLGKGLIPPWETIDW